jgi:hypothetical protein
VAATLVAAEAIAGLAQAYRALDIAAIERLLDEARPPVVIR